MSKQTRLIPLDNYELRRRGAKNDIFCPSTPDPKPIKLYLLSSNSISRSLRKSVDKTYLFRHERRKQTRTKFIPYHLYANHIDFFKSVQYRSFHGEPTNIVGKYYLKP